MAILETLVIAGLPAVLDIVKSAGGALSRKFLGLSVDDQIKLEEAGVRKLEALAKLENPYGTPSGWVVDLRASFRYIAAGVLIGGGLALAGYGGYEYAQAVDDAGRELADGIVALGMETAGAPFFFIFGEKMWQGIKGISKR